MLLVKSYRSDLANWEVLSETERGRKPGLPKAGNDFPALYKGNMFVCVDDRMVKVKLFIRNTWDFVTLTLRKTDCVYGQKIISVDLGINNCCTMAAMLSDGTVAGRKFFKLPAEYDCLRQKVGRIKRAQSHGSRCVRRLWKVADGSGRVKRGGESEKAKGLYSVCEFRNGKVYNCDLNASYNIGARYYIREILKFLPAKEGRSVLTKVPDCTRRSTCTLSSLISLNSALYASA